MVLTVMKINSIGIFGNPNNFAQRQFTFSFTFKSPELPSLEIMLLECHFLVKCFVDKRNLPAINRPAGVSVFSGEAGKQEQLPLLFQVYLLK